MDHQPSDTQSTGLDHTPDLTTPRRAMLAGLGGLAAGAFLTGKANAGPLNPPPGRIESTPGPEPRTPINKANTPGSATSLFRITEPGSYYLTGNITGESGKHGIEIAASGVTLDLMGFDLAGVPGMGDFDGVRTSASNLTDISIRNGSARNWGGAGVNLSSFIPRNCSIVDVRASGNTGFGIIMGNGSLVSGCTAYENGSNGISLTTSSTILGCMAYQNNGNGITTSNGCTISGSSAYQNGGVGIFVNFYCTISGCTASQNTGSGFRAGGGCTISGCSATQNVFGGIQVSGSANLIVGNACSSNSSGPGIGVFTSNGNRIEGNNCTDNDHGIRVNSPGNIITRNTCRGNTVNWDIVANNKVGTIFNAPNSTAISGNTGGAGVGSTDPWANFTF